MKKILLIILLLQLPFLVFAEVKIIELKHRAASDLESQVRELLDDNEKIQIAGAHLILIADGESLQAAEQLITLLDHQQINLQIRIRLSEESQQVGNDSSATVHYSNKTGVSSVLSSGFRRGNSVSVQEQTLLLTEGGRGFFEVGREIPYTAQWAAVTGDTSGYAEKIAYLTIATGFWVYPQKLLGDKVLLDVAPYIHTATEPAAKTAPLIVSTQLRTRLQVPIGQWFPLGQQLMQRDKVSRAIISWRSRNAQIDRQLEIRIDPVK